MSLYKVTDIFLYVMTCYIQQEDKFILHNIEDIKYLVY